MIQCRYEVEEFVLRVFLCYIPRQMHENYVKGTILSTARMNKTLKTVVHYLVQKDERGKHHQTDYSDKYVRMVKTVDKHLLGVSGNLLCICLEKKSEQKKTW